MIRVPTSYKSLGYQIKKIGTEGFSKKNVIAILISTFIKKKWSSCQGFFACGTLPTLARHGKTKFMKTGTK